MVVFEDGLARKSEYRRFAIRGVAGQDDVASISEVITRRFRRYLEDRERTGELDGLWTSRTRRPARRQATARQRHRPGSIPIPAATQVRLSTQPRGRRRRRAAGRRRPARARRARHRRRGALRPGEATGGGLAAGDDHPVVLPRTSEGLYLLQRVRDEAHRFAIAYHRQKRSRTLTGSSALDAVPGLGETRRKALLREFGSVKRLAEASVEEVAQVPGIGPRTAAAVVAALSGPPAGADVVEAGHR
jgi:excinuclease ABC subunit C